MTTHDVPYAGVATRAVGLAIDTVIVQGSLLLFTGMLALIASLLGGVDLGTAEKIVATALWVLAVAGYFVAFWAVGGQTPGMRAMHIRVAGPDGDSPGVWRSIIRVVGLGLCILTLFVGFIPVLFNARRRGAHDMLARTVVFYDAGEPLPEPVIEGTATTFATPVPPQPAKPPLP
jgi:uncharacterized RDD family membrane protein YckC